MYSYEKPEKTYEGTRENAKDGTIISNDLKQKTLYLCFKNPSLSEGTYITVEAIAIIPTQEFVDEWTPESQNQFYNECADALRYQPEAVKSVCGCVQNKLTSRYKPSEFNAFAETQRAAQKQSTLEECMTLMQTEVLKDKNRVKALEEEIRGLEALHDYAKLALRYQELLELGKEDEVIYYNLSRNLIFIKSFEEARTQLTKALGKYPKEEALWLNLAHLHLLTNNYREAEPIYLQYRGEKVAKKLRWEEAVAADLKVLEQMGLGNADFTKVKLALGL
jgi:tetratricopeptide (TPR) repeat protein